MTILEWGTHSDTFQSLKLDIEKVPCQLFCTVQYHEQPLPNGAVFTAIKEE